MTKKTRAQAETYYRQVRRDAQLAVQAELRELTHAEIFLTDIGEEALAAADTWRELYSAHKADHVPGWDWRKEVRRIRNRPRRVEVALWHEQTVCGLALGRISDRCVIATIHLVEANPAGNPLAGMVVPFITRYLETLAASLGCKEVSIEQPAEALVEYYESIGFGKKVMKGQRVIRQKMNLNSRLG